jgi:hypothetical protein
VSARRLGLALPVAVLLSIAASAGAQTLVEMQHGLPNARFVPAYSITQRAQAAQRAMALPSQPMLGATVSLTPDAPYAPDGSHLSFWKPSFVIGTAAGGEAGINFWGKYQDGHMNVAFAPAHSALLDCRMLSAGNITYKVYAGNSSTPRERGDYPLRDGHFLLMIAVAKAGDPLSVELWPTPATQPVGIFGCDISVINPERRRP